ncbi:MAG TPA: 3-dehydroquinate synthase [Geminicoccaceae bacterium]|nr:3-dehydroquinate synthase [Geminicoccaceae bacterium]
MSDFDTVPVALGARGYDVLIGTGLLDGAGAHMAERLGRRPLVVVTDQNLARTPHPARLEASLRAAGYAPATIVLPPGEASKSFARLQELLDALLERRPERKTVLVALGGGVIGDLAGFAAAVLLRGVDLVQIPTTLLAQVDSSVGGKTGINSRHGKNLIGAFHQPRLVLIDTAVLDDLPPRELRAGYAEVVKHAFIKDRPWFDRLEAHAAALLAGDPDARRDAIRRSVEIKAAVVAADETETTGERALLNFGHTFAHAFEALMGYDGGLLHGEAVSLGMVKAFRLSHALGHCPGEDVERAVGHLARAGLPCRPSAFGLDRPGPAAVMAAMRADKKAADARLRFVLSRGIGTAFTTDAVPEERLIAVLERDG